MTDVLKEIYAEASLTNKILEDRQLTVEQVKTIPLSTLYGYGFRNWDGQGLVLFPAWAINLLKDGEKMDCIDGTVVVKGVDYIDDDTRGGNLAFGIIHDGFKKQ